MNTHKEKSNKTVKRKVITDENGTYISEIQEFKKPEDYEEAFKQYYPKNKI